MSLNMMIEHGTVMNEAEVSKETGHSSEQARATRVRKTVGITLPIQLVNEARRLELNISKITEQALERLIKDSSSAQAHGLDSSSVQAPPLESKVAITATRVVEAPSENTVTRVLETRERDAVAANKDFKQIFGALVNDLDIAECWDKIAVKPKRKLTPQEFLQLHQTIMKHGGTIAGVVDVGLWYTMPSS